MSKFLAVDIVLLPPDNVTDIAIELNKKYEKLFRLSRRECLPHITLLQAVLPEAKLVEAEVVLNKIALEFRPIKLTAQLTNTPVFMFVANKEPELIKLHNEVINEFQNIVNYDAQPDYFYGKKANEKTVVSVRNFLDKSAYDKYVPHITIGMSNAPEIKQTIKFTSNRLAICHLGDFNTCRKILHEASLE